jgi:hypothetical protein
MRKKFWIPHLGQWKSLGCCRVGVEVLGIENYVLSATRNDWIVDGLKGVLQPGVAGGSGDGWKDTEIADLRRKVRPVRTEGHIYVDGGLMNNIPLSCRRKQQQIATSAQLLSLATQILSGSHSNVKTFSTCFLGVGKPDPPAMHAAGSIVSH